MTTAQQRIAALEGKVAEMAAEMQHLREEAFVLRTFEQIRLQHAGFPIGPAAARPSRPRHLHLLGGVS